MFKAHHHNLRKEFTVPVHAQLAPGSYTARPDEENRGNVCLCTLAAGKLLGDEKDDAGSITIIA